MSLKLEGVISKELVFIIATCGASGGRCMVLDLGVRVKGTKF